MSPPATEPPGALGAAQKPTMYFIGVTTRQSSINQIFPRWAQRLGLGDCALRGLDFRVHDDPVRYREAVTFLKNDPLSLGALVTTHKIDLCTACRDLIDDLEPLSAQLGEVSSLYKRNGWLHARAADPWTVGYALQGCLPPGHWARRGDALILGAGGSAVALAWHLSRAASAGEAPRQLHVVDRDEARLDHLRELHASWRSPLPLQCHRVTEARESDLLLAQLGPASLVVNATGLGKDAPGSPLTERAVFPEQAVVWEFNYRGNLIFLQQARAQQTERRLIVEDGWTYFIHGWTRVIADVFNIEIPTRGPLFNELSAIAAETR